MHYFTLIPEICVFVEPVLLAIDQKYGSFCTPEVFFTKARA